MRAVCMWMVQMYVTEDSMKTRGFEVCKGFENENITLPVRSTKNSAGYDFTAASDITIPSYYKELIKAKDTPVKPTLVKTGVKAYMLPDEVLFLYNRSSNPIKKGLVLANSVGVIDSDYYSNPDNDGHIMVAFYNFYPFDIKISKGDKIAQGVFQKYLVADNDNASNERLGGFGSTGK